MIETQLADLFALLPVVESRRIQKSLKIILTSGLDRDRLRRLIRAAYVRLGNPGEVIERLGVAPVFTRLLESFGVLSDDRMSAQERTELQRIPYTVWPEENVCLLSGEALELLAGESTYRNQNYLCMELVRMSARERRAWAQWLGLECSVRSEQERSHRLYAHLAIQREKTGPLSTAGLPQYLDEVFPDDPVRSPVAWFYRDVLPLYHCLRELENLLDPRCTAQETLRVLRLLKSGHVVVHAVAPAFGEKTRYKLVATRETAPALPANAATVLDDAHRQEMLF